MHQIIDSEKALAQDVIQENLRRLVRSLGAFKLVDRAPEVFGAAYGVATEGTVAAAVRVLTASGELATARPDKRLRDTVVGPAS
jgi:hypothetical protein